MRGINFIGIATFIDFDIATTISTASAGLYSHVGGTLDRCHSIATAKRRLPPRPLHAQHKGHGGPRVVVPVRVSSGKLRWWGGLVIE